MNVLFVSLMLGSIALLLSSSPDKVYSSMLEGASKGITLVLTLCAIYAVCMAIIDITKKLALDKRLERLCHPMTRALFPNEDSETHLLITSNMALNMLGMGSAATPLGIKAVERMQGDNARATQNSVLFAVINATSIQLIPTTIIGMRASHGASSPSDIIVPSLISTTIATLVGIVLVKIIYHHE